MYVPPQKKINLFATLLPKKTAAAYRQHHFLIVSSLMLVTKKCNGELGQSHDYQNSHSNHTTQHNTPHSDTAVSDDCIVRYSIIDIHSLTMTDSIQCIGDDDDDDDYDERILFLLPMYE